MRSNFFIGFCKTRLPRVTNLKAVIGVCFTDLEHQRIIIPFRSKPPYIALYDMRVPVANTLCALYSLGFQVTDGVPWNNANFLQIYQEILLLNSITKVVYVSK